MKAVSSPFGPWLGTISTGLSASRASRLANHCRRLEYGLPNAGCAFMAMSPENNTRAPSLPIAVSPGGWVGPIGHGPRFYPAEIDIVVLLEGDVGLAEVRALEQFSVQWRARGENFRQFQAEFGNVLLLVGRADHLGRGRKRLRAEIVLGMEVSDDQEERPSTGELLRHLQHGGPVARAEPRVDDQRSTLADDHADGWHHRHP